MPSIEDQQDINQDCVDTAEEFVKELGFFDDPSTYFYILATKPNLPPGSSRPKHFSKPKLLTSLWLESNHTYNQVYSTATLRDPEINNTIKNCVATPIMFGDIDCAKKFGFDEQFYDFVKEQVPASCYVKSSSQGIQLLFKLDKPVVWNGDPDKWEAKLGGVLTDFCYYIGGDPAVITPARNMRLPGSYNVKPEYKNSWLVSCEYNRNEDNSLKTYSLTQLEKMYTLNPHVVPLSIWYAIRRVFDKHGCITGAGNRHYFYMALAGTLLYGNWNPPSSSPGVKALRKGGIDKGSVITLFKMLCKHYGDDDLNDRLRLVEDTFKSGAEEDGRSTLGSGESEYKAVQKDLEPIMDAWVTLRTWYGKKRNCPLVNVNSQTTEIDDIEQVIYDENGEAINVESPDALKKGNGAFVHKDDGKTWFCSTEAGGTDALFSNFQIIPRGTLRRAVSNTVIWQCTLKFASGRGIQEYPIEIGAASLSSMTKLRQDLAGKLPPGVACFKNTIWEVYIDWLTSLLPSKTLQETTYYGIVGVKEGKPSILLPGQDHPEYIWLAQNEDTALDGVHNKEITKSEATEYLTSFAKYYPEYHVDSYIIPALGFYSACVISELIRFKLNKGFPLLLIYGNKGCGKSQLISSFLGPHFGTKTPAAYGPGLTPFAAKRHIISNNITPFPVDEFRDTVDDYGRSMKGLFNHAYDQSSINRGTKEGGIDSSIPKAPMVIIGEHDYDESSTIDRTFKIRIDKSWVSTYRDKCLDPVFADFSVERDNWIKDSAHVGMMLNIILRWVENNFSVVNEIIEQAVNLLKDPKYPHPHVSPRIEKCLISVVAGNLLLRNVYAAYGLKYMWSMKTIMNAIFTASVLEDSGKTDFNVLRILFQATDHMILEAARNNRSLLNTVYIFDPHNPDICYMESKRWYGYIQAYLKTSTTASLMRITSFIDMLADNAGVEGSPIISVNSPHPVFRSNCVVVNLKIIEDMLGINAKQWAIISNLDMAEERGL